MKGEITLKNPILIDGKSVETLTYDANEITSDLFIDAETLVLKRRTRGGGLSVEAKLDYSFQLSLGQAAIIAVNSNYTFEDLNRVKGFDLQSLREIGQNFIVGRSEESSGEISSGDLSATTPEISAPQPQNYENSD